MVLSSCITAPSDAVPGKAKIDRGVTYSEADGLELLAHAAHASISRKDVHAVALYDFATADGHYTRLGRHFGDLFLSALMEGIPDYEVYDRLSMKVIEQETQYNLNQLFSDPANFKQIGEFLQADAAAFGTLSQQSSHWDVHVRIVRTTTGSVLYAGSARLKATSDHMRMFTRLPPGE
jgi:TolB-like protein